MLKRGWVAIGVLSAVFISTGAPSASAFDGGPHSEITADAMRTEGFGGDAIGVAQVSNWFSDFYEQAAGNSFTDHGEILSRVAAGAVQVEHWPDALVKAALLNHFDWVPEIDAPTQLGSTAGVAAEWDRLRRATWTLVREAREEDDPEKLVMVLGMSLHAVQDFYAHTNWVEAQGGLGADGPGWEERGFGIPTWFDVPPDVREAANVYADTAPGKRSHGYWDTDGNTSMVTGMNKDWPGRPDYLDAATAAYFATRQWIEALRSWVGDEAFWAKTQDYRADRAALRHDQRGKFEVSLYVGHWQGGGEPTGSAAPGIAGSVLDLRQAIKRYMQPSKAELIGTVVYPGLGTIVGNSFTRSKTRYRTRFERLIMRLTEPNPTGQLGPVPSSQELQRSMRFVVLRITHLRSEGLGDPGGGDPADMYANVRIDGQPMTSSVINGADRFEFLNPYEPFTWIKAVPAAPEEVTPVESIVAEVKTADKRWAGTNDNVYLRLGPNLRFQLDKSFYNDFERGDLDTYSVPIDDAVKNGMTVGDITEVKIEKDTDGIAGGWMLGSVRLRVNGSLVANDEDIDRWLEDGRREWKAPDFEPEAPIGTEIPIWINLREHDLTTSDDEGDINPFGQRHTVLIPFPVGGSLRGAADGGNNFGGRTGDGDEATIHYQVETLVPKTMSTDSPSPEPPPTPPEAKPDLVITAFDFHGVTILNQGPGPSGPFRVRAGNAFEIATINFGGLAPGASETRPLSLSCGGLYQAIVDDLQLVDELDESNNEAPSEPVGC